MSPLIRVRGNKKGMTLEYFGIQSLTLVSEGKGKSAMFVKPYVGEMRVLGVRVQNSQQFLQ